MLCALGAEFFDRNGRSFCPVGGTLSDVARMGQQDDLGDVNGCIEEMINGQKVVKVFCHEEQSKATFREKNDRLCYSSTQANIYGNILMPVVGSLGYILYVLVAVVGGAAGIAGLPNLSLTGINVLTIGMDASSSAAATKS